MNAKFYSAWLRIEFKKAPEPIAVLKIEHQAEAKQANKYQLLQHIKGETSQKSQQDRAKNESKPKRPPTVTENRLKNQIDRGCYDGVSHYYARYFTLFPILLCWYYFLFMGAPVVVLCFGFLFRGRVFFVKANSSFLGELLAGCENRIREEFKYSYFLNTLL